MSFNLIDEQKLKKIFDEIGALREELKAEIVKNRNKLTETWLDNQEVMEVLKISPRTLQSMRDSCTIPFSKVGGKIYYKASDVEKLLEANYHETL
ncbi:MAG: helix-turn-helix domain-containing protein [Elusimicrobiota bacterium]